MKRNQRPRGVLSSLSLPFPTLMFSFCLSLPLPFENLVCTKSKSSLARIRRLVRDRRREIELQLGKKERKKERSEIWETVVTGRVEHMLSQRLPNNPPASLSPPCYILIFLLLDIFLISSSPRGSHHGSYLKFSFFFHLSVFDGVLLVGGCSGFSF